MICSQRLTYNFTSKEERQETEEFLRSNYIVKKKIETTSSNDELPRESFQCDEGNLRVWMNANRISIDGSIWKYYLGSNDGEFTNEQIVKAYEKLQYNLPTIDWSEATFSKLHYGPNFIVSNSPDLYSMHIEGNKGKKRSVIDYKSVTVSVGSDSNQMVFYNKSEESKGYTGTNILRIEHRIDSAYWRKKYFGYNYPTITTLLNNLNILPEIRYQQYKSLDKNYSPKILLVDSVATLRQLAMYTLGYANASKILHNSYKAGKLNESQFSYGKRWISELRNKGKDYALDNQPLNELDNLVEEFINKKRSKL